MIDDDDFVQAADARPAPVAVSVAAESGHVLTIRCKDGSSLRVNLSGWIALHDIAELRNEAVFARPEIGEYGYSIQWTGDEDLSIDTTHLRMLAEQQQEFDAADLVAWQARRHVSNQEAADLFGVAPNTWLNYRKGTTRIPGGVAIAIRAMDRDPLLFAANFRPRRNGRPPAAAE